MAGLETLAIRTPDGRTLECHVAGPPEGDVLLFHDGTPGSGLPPDAFVETAAARNLRSVTFARPGYATSTRRPGRSVADVAEDAVAVLDHFGADRCFTMGASGGGPHALACAALIPERVRATTVIAGVAPFNAAGLDFLAGMAQENVEEFGAAVEGSDALVHARAHLLEEHGHLSLQVALLGPILDQMLAGAAIA